MSLDALAGRTSAAAEWRVALRIAALAFLVMLEAVLLEWRYTASEAVAGAPPPVWAAFNHALRYGGLVVLYAAAPFCILAFSQHRALATAWIDVSRRHEWGRWLVAELALFAALLSTLPLIQAGAGAPPWIAFSFWLCGGAAMLAAGLLSIAPASFWRAFAARNVANAVIALIVGGFTFGALMLAQNSWSTLASATLQVSYALLRLYEANPTINADERVLGAGGFEAEINSGCSGYEGVGLVLIMLSLYTFAFRRQLRFPHVLALLPIGAAAIWLLNAVRLALLVSIGEHISPAIAGGGFHSQAGWVFFLAVTVSLMTLAHQSRYFRRDVTAKPAKSDEPALRLAAAMLAPFAALMLARILAAILGEDAHWASAASLLAPAAVIWIYRDAIRPLLGPIKTEPVLIGLAVGALWIATEPRRSNDLGVWISSQSAAESAAWLTLRVFGFALVVPIAEELVFRGYLHRALVRRRFEDAEPAAFSWLAFLVTSLMFGAMHGRWLAGALAGAAFAIALYRSRSLSGPITAHVAANGLIAAYAVAAQDWGHL